MSIAMQALSKHLYAGQPYTALESILDDPIQMMMASRHPLPRSTGGDLDILSASQYPQGLMQAVDDVEENPRKRKATPPSHLYGGVYLNGASTDSHPSSTGEPDPPQTRKKPKPSKRSPTNEDDQSESKKQRGRPRLDTQDATAADRRRTQIRLAQRAYRHRKETTISALKQKVTTLQDTIEQMNQTFLTLHDNLLDAGILSAHFSLGRQLQSATESFIALARNASPESDEDEENSPQIGKDEPKHSLSGVTESNRRGSSSSSDPRSLAASNAIPTSKTKASSSTSIPQKHTKELPRIGKPPGPALIDEDADVEELPSMESNPENFFALSQIAWSGNESNLYDFNELIPLNDHPFPGIPANDDPSEKVVVERPLTPANPQGVYTYSFQETTFARRLHRMCLERGFRTLTSPHVDPEYIKTTFRFTFCFSNRKRMRERFQLMLKRKAGESLENFNAPYFHIGGAGTHFPRRDDDGNPIYPPNIVSPARAFGPQPWVEVETPMQESSTQEMLENIGYGGIWYDSHDVEEYLKTMGIYLDGQSSYVEVDSSILALIHMATISSETPSSGPSPLGSSIHTPSPLLGHDLAALEPADPSSSPDGHLFPLHGGPALVSAVTADPKATESAGWADFPGTATAAFLDNPASSSSSWPSFAPTQTPDLTDLLGPHPLPQSPLTFDVELFLERMLDGSACLGRAPGFRKATIDAALVASLQETF